MHTYRLAPGVHLRADNGDQNAWSQVDSFTQGSGNFMRPVTRPDFSQQEIFPWYPRGCRQWFNDPAPQFMDSETLLNLSLTIGKEPIPFIPYSSTYPPSSARGSTPGQADDMWELRVSAPNRGSVDRRFRISQHAKRPRYYTDNRQVSVFVGMLQRLLAFSPTSKYVSDWVITMQSFLHWIKFSQHIAQCWAW